MCHMKRAADVEAQLPDAEAIGSVPVEKPDFLARMRKIHGDVILHPSNAELLAVERERF